MSIEMEKSQKPTGYLPLKNRKATGSHYTPKLLADFVAVQMLKARHPSSTTKKIRILDPAAGDGELLLSLLSELLKNHAVETIKVTGFDTDDKAIEQATARIKALYPDIAISISHQDFLEYALLHTNHDLFGLPPFDLIIANPPYVRTQVMGTKTARKLARRFNLSGRVDLYYAFIEGITRVLGPNGVVGIIVSNRFMTTKSGADVRANILRNFEPVHVWDLGDTQIFKAAVLPGVLILKDRTTNQKAGAQIIFTSVYAQQSGNISSEAIQRQPDIVAALDCTGLISLDNGKRYVIQHGTLNHGESIDGVWRIGTDKSNAWLSTVDTHSFCRFGDLGKVRVGVKTTSDAVFIRSDWNSLPRDEQPEVLRPLITHIVARRFKAIRTADQLQILYTHEMFDNKRVPIDLTQLPRTEKYLNKHRSVLENRSYVTRAKRKWYEIWVPHDPNGWKKPKLVFRDIAEKPTFWLDFSGAVVNGDCYWLTEKNGQYQDLLWLAMAVANSSFIERFYDMSFHNKLYSGRRRFITQYVEKFPLPNPELELTRNIISLTKQIYDLIPNDSVPAPEAAELETKLDRLVWQAFGLEPEESPW